MADTTTTSTGAGSSTDEKKTATGGEDFTNLKAEMNRKMSNLETSNKAMMDQLKAIATNMPKPAPNPKEKKSAIKDLWWDDPEAAAAKIKEEASQSIMDQIRKENAANTSRNATIGNLYTDYPELADLNHPLTKKAVEIFDALPEADRNSPLAYRLAVKEAAMDLKVPAKKQRGDDYNDDFSGLSGGGTSGGGNRKKREAELDPRTVDFAKMVGLDTDDPKIMENLKKRNSRKTWQRWE